MEFPTKYLYASLGLGTGMVLYGVGVWNGNSAFASGELFGPVSPEIASVYPLAAAAGMLFGILVRAVISVVSRTSGKWAPSLIVGGAAIAATIAIGGLWRTGGLPFFVMAFFVGWTFSCSSIYWMTYISLKSLSPGIVFPVALFIAAGGNAICCFALQAPKPLIIGGLVLLSALLALLDRSSSETSSVKRHIESGLVDVVCQHLITFKKFADVLICVMALQIIAPSTNYLGLMDMLQPQMQLFIVCLAQLSAGLLSLLVLNLFKGPHSTKFFQYVTPVLVSALLFVPFAGHEYTLVMLFIGSSLYFAASNALYCSDAVRFSRDENVPFESFYAIGYLILAAMNILMENLMPKVLNTQSSTELLTVFSAFFCVYVLSMTFLIARGRRSEAQHHEAEVDSKYVSESEEQHQEEQPASRLRYASGAVDIVKQRHGLSEREAEILDLILRGKNVPAIAETLFISQNTVRSHVKRIYRATGIHTRQDLISYCEDSIGAE